MSGTTIAYKIGANAMTIPIYNGDSLSLIACVSICVIIFRAIISKAWRAVYAGRPGLNPNGPPISYSELGWC